MTEDTQQAEDERDYLPGQEPVSSDKKFEVLAAEADGFYRMVVTVSTAFLGGSILFVERIAPQPIPQTLWLLAAGWMALVSSIYFIVQVRRGNLESIRLALEGNYGDARSIDAQTRLASALAQWGMIAGMILISAYGMTNLVLRKEGRVDTQRMVVKIEGPVPLSIAGGSAGGSPRDTTGGSPGATPPATPAPTPKGGTGKP